jgi:diphosphomevalonate decarboxylase
MAAKPDQLREASALAHSNIAFAKYWGKRDVIHNLPAVSSISLTLAALTTRTTVCFDPEMKSDELVLNRRRAATVETERVSRFLTRIRGQAGIATFARVNSDNDFPTAAGLASSASGFAALAVAAANAAGLCLSPPQLSALARYGSASAARSIFGGFVELPASDDPATSAEPLLDPDAWPLEVLIAITNTNPKTRSSSQAMIQSATTSPYYAGWVRSSEDDRLAMKAAIVSRDFERLAEISENSCLKLHGLILSTRPPTLYWSPTTVALIEVVYKLRQQGIPVFFTIDAGPQVKAVCPAGGVDIIRPALLAVPGVRKVIYSKPGEGAHLLEGL